jgi:hypothetical protein
MFHYNIVVLKGGKIMIAGRIASISLIVLGCLCLIGCSKGTIAKEPYIMHETKGNMTEAKDSKSSKDMSCYPVIGHLRTKNKFITIRTGPNGPLYTVEAKDGKILAENLPAEKLYAEFPELKNVLEQGIAVNDASIRLRNKEGLTPIIIHRAIQK